MLKITVYDKELDLPEGFSMEVEDTNPIYNERGSQSVPATVPATPRNLRLLAFPTRVDSGTDPASPLREAEVCDGPYIRRGLLNITSAGRSEGITFNIGFDNSTAYQKWSSKKLSELSTLPVVEGSQVGYENSVDGIIDYMTALYKSANPKTAPLAVFPVAIGREEYTDSSDSSKKATVYWEMLNVPTKVNGQTSLRQPSTLRRILDGTPTDVTVPYGYGLSPFVRVWKILNLIFEDLGVTLDNPLKNDPEFNRLVILNNAADAICTGVIRYADLMPDCTVAEFLDSLWAKFGLVYNIDYNTARASMKFLRDIIREPAALELLNLASGNELITYESPKYVKITAKTGLEGAEPPVERFEDFAKGLDIRGVHLGADVSDWTFTPNGTTGGRWSGDVRDDWWEAEEPDPGDIEQPEPGDDEDREETPAPWDDRDDYADYYSAPARTKSAGTESAKNSNTFLAHEFVTGNWFKIDSENKKIRQSGSGFFNWDPQPEGCEAFELAPADECVPVMRVNTVGSHSAHEFNSKCPAFLEGARHYHSFIKGNDSDEEGISTPLAFVIAYTFDGSTIGRISPEDDNGAPINLPGGPEPKLTLYYQFADGLFAQFWSGFDEILRHGNRLVELPANADKLPYSGIDMLSPVSIRGIRCLVDGLTYSLPAGNHLDARIKLRTLVTQGRYNISKEQNIPQFNAGARRLAWVLKTETFGQIDPTSAELRAEAARIYCDATAYEPHGTEGDWYEVSAGSAVPDSVKRHSLTWETDTSLIKPTYAGLTLSKTYQAICRYMIYELHDMSVQDGPEDYELLEPALAPINILVPYTVELVAKWVLA